MARGLYKPGQGYWVRVLTAAMLGVITLATGGWVWSQARLAVAAMPRTAWEMNLRDVSGAPAEGARVELLGVPSETTGERPVLGTATVASYEPANEFLRLRRIELTADQADVVQTRVVRTPDAAFRGEISGRPAWRTPVDPLYVQGGMMAAVILVGAALTYLFVGVKPRSVDFLIATDMEMKKVNWSTWKDIRGSTTVVIVCSVLIAVALFFFDTIFRIIFQGIGVLVR